MEIPNGPKWTMFISSELGLLQMILELVTRRCASEDARPSEGVDYEIPHLLEALRRGGLWDPTSTGEGKKHFLQGFEHLSLVHAV